MVKDYAGVAQETRDASHEIHEDSKGRRSLLAAALEVTAAKGDAPSHQQAHEEGELAEDSPCTSATTRPDDGDEAAHEPTRPQQLDGDQIGARSE